MSAPASASLPPSAEPRPDEVVRVVPSAGGGSSRRRYDFLGRLRLDERPDGSWLRYRYDDAGRPVAVEHSSGERVEYEVCHDGRVWRARTGRTETTIRIDEAGFPAEVETVVDGVRLAVAYRRDPLGRVEGCRYPGGEEWLRFERDDGRIAVRAGDRTYCVVEELGRGTSAVFANGVRIEETLGLEPRPRVERVVLHDVGGSTVLDTPQSHDADDRVTDAGGRSIGYDEEGRLTSWGELRVEYDESGRLVRRGGACVSYGASPAATGAEADAGRVAFEVDLLGRRVARRGSEGTTRYAYDLFDRLVGIELPDGGTARYVYDGFGRLVAREHDGRTEYYAVGIDGHRLARADGDGTVTDSYVWLGEQCVARLDGPVGAPLAESFHRVDAAGVAAVGAASGDVELTVSADPFGSDRRVEDGRPGYAGLFGDPCTGLLYAGARWLDPLTAQFLTPDSWYSEDVASRLPPALAPLLTLLPGGALRVTDPVAAYAWCGYDPVNRWDPGGHNWLGLIFSTISALLWEMQLTSISLQMEVLNIIVFVILLIPYLICRGAGSGQGFQDFFEDYAVTNIAPPTASARLMVPFALLLNGVLRIHKDRAWTLGNVVWIKGSSLGELETGSKRTLLLCGNASSYLSAVEDATATNTFRVRSPASLRKGTVTDVGAAAPNQARITGVAPPTTGVYTDPSRDFVAVRIEGATTDEVRRATVLSPTELRLDAPALPDVFLNETVEVRRLDPAVVRISGAGKTLARVVTFVRGTAIHFAGQTPQDYLPADGLAVTEFLLPEQPKRRTNVSLPTELVIVRFAAAADRAGYVAGTFVRLLTLSAFHARRVTATPGDADLVIDSALPAGDHTDIEVVPLDRVGAVATAQTAAGDRVRCGRLIDLLQRDGIAIDTTPPGPVPELRIVLELLLDCTVAALPADVQNVEVAVDLLVVGADRVNGKVKSSTEIELGGAPAFGELDAVRVTKSGPVLHAFDVAASISAATPQVLTLKEPLPAAFTATPDLPVVLRKLEQTTSFAADQVVAPGDHVFVRVQQGNALKLGDLVRVRSTAGPTGGAARAITAAPTVVAQVDSAVPAALAADLRVQRLAPNDALKRTGATAPPVRQRLIVSGANPYVANDVLHLVGGEQTVATVATVDGANVILAEPIVGLALTNTVSVVNLAATGIASADGKLDEGLVLIPSDPDESPLTRREALEHHEMRHVWQGAIWGPFLLSMPIPWLLNLGFSFSGAADRHSKLFRAMSAGGINMLFAAAVWGIGSRNSPTELQGEVANNARTLIRFPQLADAAKVEKFSSGSRIDVFKGGVGTETFNVVEKLEDRDVTLRFALDKGKFASGDLVMVSVSPYERIRKIVSLVFGNFEELWRDHIPTAWGRALSRLLNSDGWMPGLGIYPLSLLVAGGAEDRLPNEQDAAYHSGDLYTSIALTRSSRVFVGQFARIFGFVQTRDEIFQGISQRGALGLLEVELDTGFTAADVAGGVPSSIANRVRFREHYYIPLHEKIENAIGAWFSASKPGRYTVRATGDLDPETDVVFTFAFAVSFLELRRIQVDALGVTPDGADPLFETEVVPFAIAGDSSAEYRLRFPPGAAVFGKVDGLRYTAGVLPTGTASEQHTLEITATYPETHPVFSGPGQAGPTRLTLEERTNLCQTLPLTVQEIAEPALAPTKAGETQDFTMPLAPVSATVRPLGAGATGIANVIIRPGRPATLTFVAPAAVTAALTATIDMVFGSDPTVRKPVTATVQITP